MSESFTHRLLLSHLAATLFMTGLIWFVQVVHYPLYASIGPAEFPLYEQSHTSWTPFVVGPPMLWEGISAVLLCAFKPANVSTGPMRIGVILLAIIWLSTAWLQIPCHDVLSRGFDPVVHERLVRTNWIRTVAWTLRGLLALYLVSGARPPGDR